MNQLMTVHDAVVDLLAHGLLGASPWQVVLITLVLSSVVAPFFILQPAFGFGIAASKTAAPYVARRRSVITHLTFGLGLFVAGWLVLLFYPAQA